MTARVRDAVLTGANTLGVNALLRGALRNRLLILRYQSVLPEELACGICQETVTLPDFKRQLQWVLMHFRPVSPRDVLAWSQGGPDLPPQSVLLTVDGGFHNCLAFAVPELQRLGVPALLNISAVHVGTKDHLWTLRLRQCVLRWTENVIPMPLGVPSRPMPPDQPSRCRLAREIVDAGKLLPEDVLRDYVEQLAGRFPPSAFRHLDEAHPFPSWESLGRLHESGLSVGSHGLSYVSLPRLPKERLEEELVRSKALIETHTGTPCDWVAYPFGTPEHVGPTVVDAARKAGFQVGLTLYGSGRVDPAEPLLFDRVSIDGLENEAAFLGRLSGLHFWLSRKSRPVRGWELFRTRIVRDFDELEELSSEWERLASSAPKSGVFNRWEWIRAWWRAYGDERELCTPVVWHGDRIVGIWPLCLHGPLLRAMGTPRSDANDILCHPRNAVAVLVTSLEALHGLLPRWTALRVEHVPECSNLQRSLAECPFPWRDWARFEPGQPSMRIDFGENGDDASVAERLLGNKHLRRKEHRLSRFGPVDYRHIEDRGEILARLPSFFDQHIRRRALVSEASMFRRDRERNFYRYLVEELDPSSILRFGMLSVGDRPAGYHLGFEADGTYVCYKPTFDPELARWSPGEVLFRRIFEYVAAKGLRVCDFTVGGEAFKYRFANVHDHTWTLTVYPGVLHNAAGEGWHRLTHPARSRASVQAPLRKLRGLGSRIVG